MAKQQRTWGIFISQLALALYFIVTAFCLITRAGSSISSAEIEAITRVFGKGAYIVNVIVGIVLLLCGIMFALKAFGMDFGKIRRRFQICHARALDCDYGRHADFLHRRLQVDYGIALAFGFGEKRAHHRRNSFD